MAPNTNAQRKEVCDCCEYQEIVDTIESRRRLNERFRGKRIPCPCRSGPSACQGSMISHPCERECRGL